MGDFVYDYQTLITGFLAIGAAYYAGAPVWRQLRDSNLQAMIAHRDNLAIRFREAEQRMGKVKADLEPVLFDLGNLTSDPVGNPTEIDPHDAFQMESRMHGILDWYLVASKDTEDQKIEEKKLKLGESLRELEATLNDVHWIIHNQQHDEDHSISDDEWAKILEQSRAAPLLASSKLSDVWITYREWRESEHSWILQLRTLISNLDARIAAFSH